MCGICFLITLDEDKGDFDFSTWLNEENSGLVGFLRNRGPDSLNIHSETVEIDGQRVGLHGAVSVLAMRGENSTEQPLKNEKGDFLLFNGEIYGGLSLKQDETYANINDAEVLLRNLTEIGENFESVLNLASNLNGPFTFVYFCRSMRRVWIGKDSFGRCSFLWSFDSDSNSFRFSSLKPPNSSSAWRETPAGRLICVNLASCRTGERESGARTENDSLVDVLSTKFQDVACFDLVGGRKLFQLCKDVQACRPNDVQLGSSTFQTYVDDFLRNARGAIERRLECLMYKCREYSNRSNVAILFSGGVDSLLLTALVDELWPKDQPIDLFNVAFERNDVKSENARFRPSAVENSRFQVPDRITGRASLAELRTVAKRECRQWNFVEIDVTRRELDFCRQNRVVHLLHPCCTVLDDSIGCALWFAARGRGTVDGREYESPARVVFIGSGADELLAGYSRHRTRFAEGGWTGLIDELQMELERLPYRNLGRDDRILSDHGREPQAPFLDETFVEFVNSLPIDVKANFDLPRGSGEKFILRAALRRLGFGPACQAPKRAVQFGTRIAKAENRKERGADRCERLTVVK